MRAYLMLGVLFCSGLAWAAEPARLIADFSQPDSRAHLQANESTLTNMAAGHLCVVAKSGARWPGVTLRPPTDVWNLSSYRRLMVQLHNPTDLPQTINVRVDDTQPGRDIHFHEEIAPHSDRVIEVPLSQNTFHLSKPLGLVGLRGISESPGKFDAAHVKQLTIFLSKATTPGAFEWRRIEAEGTPRVFAADTFLPFVDEFGQFRHADWPGKLHNAEEFAKRRSAEEADLAAHPAPKGRDVYGGWAEGPQLEATGFFRTTKHEGQWWLVDPAGRLFWSYGVDCVHSGLPTPLTGRTNYFAWLPPRRGEFAGFYSWMHRASVGYYTNMNGYLAFNFSSANLLRKYGAAWPTNQAAMAHRRLASWGFNTIGNWSDPDIRALQRTPYVASISPPLKPIAGSEGYWGKFPDPFRPDFAEQLHKALTKEKGVGDPWCLGFFVHNELSWGNETSLAVATLKSPADQPAKQALLADLQAKYGDIAKLNTAWGTQHASWKALAASRTPPDVARAHDDLTAFYTRIAERYFETCRNAIKRVAPHQLYLGCRFTSHRNERAERAAGKFCDVISFNFYKYSVAEQQLPAGVDKPMIIGEFHFGALDRGLLHTGLKATRDQNDRAEKYRDYLRGALKNPGFVGAHWFEYRDEPVTGRFDGENYQIGFVDICDMPYLETVQAAREIGAELYSLRTRKQP